MMQNKWLSPAALIIISVCWHVETKHLRRSMTVEYWAQRADIFNYEETLQIGSSVNLNEDEERVNYVLMHHKYAELDAGLKDPSKFIASQHFFQARETIKNSPIFRLLRAMPKGGLLHTHSTATTNFDYIYSLTKRDNVYVCRNKTSPKLKFFSIPDDNCAWELVSELRDIDGDDFENYLVKHMTLIRDHPNDVYTDINKVWRTFEDLFVFISQLLHYIPVLKEHFRETLIQLYNDNITYVELRSSLSSGYDLDGNTFTSEEIIKILIDIADEFKAEHPDFIGVKFIYALGRNIGEKIDKHIETAERLKELYPDFIAGFDLVGQEDLGPPLIKFARKLQTMDMDFFFHAGETNWNQESTDQNLIDAILLGTKRIGHGFAAIKHPYVMEQTRKKGIAFEVSPISNQVLMLIRDLRNHPASIFIANDIPMVITNDDPAFWGAEGVTYDWYLIFMAIASRNADLRLLKQLAINSLEYSSMRGKEKEIAIEKWTRDWYKFIAHTIKINQHLV